MYSYFRTLCIISKGIDGFNFICLLLAPENGVRFCYIPCTPTLNTLQGLIHNVVVPTPLLAMLNPTAKLQVKSITVFSQLIPVCTFPAPYFPHTVYRIKILPTLLINTARGQTPTCIFTSAGLILLSM